MQHTRSYGFHRRLNETLVGKRNVHLWRFGFGMKKLLGREQTEKWSQPGAGKVTKYLGRFRCKPLMDGQSAERYMRWWRGVKTEVEFKAFVVRRKIRWWWRARVLKTTPLVPHPPGDARTPQSSSEHRWQDYQLRQTTFSWFKRCDVGLSALFPYFGCVLVFVCLRLLFRFFLVVETFVRGIELSAGRGHD